VCVWRKQRRKLNTNDYCACVRAFVRGGGWGGGSRMCTALLLTYTQHAAQNFHCVVQISQCCNSTSMSCFASRTPRWLGQCLEQGESVTGGRRRKWCRNVTGLYRGADKSLPRPTSRCILFDGENISFDSSFLMYIYSTNISPIMIILVNRICEHQNLLSL